MKVADVIAKNEEAQSKKIEEHVRECKHCETLLVAAGQDLDFIGLRQHLKSSSFPEELEIKLYNCPDWPSGLQFPKRYKGVPRSSDL